jgi:hypothetical protein
MLLAQSRNKIKIKILRIGRISLRQTRSIHLGETGPYRTDIANPWVSGAALFFISNRSVGKRGNTSSFVGYCIL